ncbi:MAG: ATP-dependent RecD-like DNA helicase [Clostridia bacterium]
MSETTGEEASTIHRLLEIGKMEETLDIEKLDYPISPIDADIIIIDEMSMVDTFLMNYILKGVYLGTKLILVGDVNQLASVGAGNILKDIINSGKITTIELNEIFRQAAKSKIITNAHKVNNGESFFENNEEGQEEDFFFINEVSQEKMLSDIISLCSGRLKKYGDYDFFKDIQVLTPTKKGNFGTKELNKELQKVLNGEEKEEKKYGDVVFKTGDRVMQIKNNYDIFWEKEFRETGSGIFNGEMGQIEAIDDTSKALKVLFDDGKKAWYEYNELEQLEHSYSITIHKSQRK